MSESVLRSSDVIFLEPRGGRAHSCGPVHALFKADGAETWSRYSVSEWWIEPQQIGVGPHSHEANDELFYVIAGVMTFLVGEETVEGPTGSFLRVPAGVVHGFENRTSEPAGVLNVFIPGGFEERMPEVVAWFEAHPDGT